MTRSQRWLRTTLAVLLIVFVAGCAQTKSYLTTAEIPEKGPSPRVLVMAPDIELYELTAAGLLEPNAAWTAAARVNVDDALRSALEARNARFIRYTPSDPDASFDPEHLQAIKLHGAVGKAILLHKYQTPLALPTKKDSFDWTLGEAAAALRQSYDADYALFVYFRESFASAGRVAVIFVGALFGVGVPGGAQVGFASLVDLESGDIVWFNRLRSGTGDLREAGTAHSATENLLTELPL